MFKYILIFTILFLVLPSYLKIALIILLIIWLLKRRFVFIPDASQFSLFFGLPGSGKSTVLAYIAWMCLKRKSCTVLCNVPIKGTLKLSRSDLGVYDISTDAFGTDECVVIFDEASIDYFKRDFDSFSKEENKFHSLHRHAGVHEVFACQTWDGMDKRLRELNTKLYFVDKWYFNLIRIRTIAKDFDIQDKQPLDGYEFEKFSSKFVYAPKVWKLFDSFDKSNLPKRKKEWKVWE